MDEFFEIIEGTVGEHEMWNIKLPVICSGQHVERWQEAYGLDGSGRTSESAFGSCKNRHEELSDFQLVRKGSAPRRSRVYLMWQVLYRNTTPFLSVAATALLV